MEPILVYLTIGTSDDAEALCKQLVADKLIACANIYPIRSIYEWQGQIMSEGEFSIILKTQNELWAKLQTRIVELHPYGCPCIMSIPLTAVHEPYRQWLNQQVG